MSIHVESDYFDRSAHKSKNFFHGKNRHEKLRVFVFRYEGKNLLTLFGEDISSYMVRRVLQWKGEL